RTASSTLTAAPVPHSWKRAALVAAVAGAGIGLAALAWRYYSSNSDSESTLAERITNAPNTNTTLEATPTATLEAEKAAHEIKFKEAAESYLTVGLASENYTSRAYKNFIDAQRVENHHVPQARM